MIFGYEKSGHDFSNTGKQSVIIGGVHKANPEKVIVQTLESSAISYHERTADGGIE